MSYFTFILLVLLPINVLASSVSWNTESVTVKQGDTLSLTCTVSDMNFMDVIRVSFKNSEGEIWIFSDNKDIKLPFSKIPRYHVEFKNLDQRGNVTISYKEIRGEDMGSLLCQKLTNENTSSEVKVHVQVPVKQIYLSQRTLMGQKKLKDMDTVFLREMTDNELECVAVVDGGLAPTELQITIGNEDKTQFFTASEESKVIKSHESDIGQYYSEFKLTYSTMVPSIEFNGLLLTCIAIQDGFSNVSTSALIKVEYGPVIMCDKYEHHSKLNNSLDFVCEVSANPECTSIAWTMDSTALSGPLASNNIFQLSETAIDGSRKQVRLTIKNVEKMHFTSYFLSAKNEISSAEVTILLLPASLELSQIPSSQEQMAMLRQQMPITDLAESVASYWKTGNLEILLSLIGLVVIFI